MNSLPAVFGCSISYKLYVPSKKSGTRYYRYLYQYFVKVGLPNGYLQAIKQLMRVLYGKQSGASVAIKFWPGAQVI